MPEDGSDLETLTSATEGFIAACRLVGADELSATTPCPDWDVTQLIDHVTGGNRFTISVLHGNDGDSALGLAMASFDGPHDVIAAGVESAHAQRTAFQEPGVLQRPCQHLLGNLTGLQVLRLRLHDLVIHTWDLHQAIGSDRAIETDHVRWATAELADPESLTAQHFASIGNQDPRSADDLLTVFGRRPIGPNRTGS